MAALSLYFKDAVAPGSVSLGSLQRGGSAPSTATTGTGWIMDNTPSGNYADVKYGTIANSWSGTVRPTAGISTDSAFRTEDALSGVFADANWTIALAVVAVDFADGTSVGRLRYRLFRSTSPTGASATEMTSGTIETGSVFSSLTPSTISVTWSPGSTHTLAGEYLFLQTAYRIMTAGGSDPDANNYIRVGSASLITTSDFAEGGALDPLGALGLFGH